MSRNVFRRCEAYLQAKGQQIDTSVWNKVSWSAGEKSDFKFLAVASSLCDNTSIKAIAIMDMIQILSVQTKSEVTQVIPDSTIPG